MDLGEGVAVSACGVPPEVELAAELVSVTFKSPVTVSRARARITGPHWERGREAEIEDDWSATARKMRLPPEPYSTRAAVFLVSGAGDAHDVEVKVRITRNQNVSGQAVLVGALSGLTIEGSCPSAAGEHTVAARIANPPETAQAFRGRIGWALASEGAGITLGLGTTLAEIYFILDQPKPPFAGQGVWVEALRFVCGRIGPVDSSDAQAIAGRIARYCHSQHSLRYETERGASRYGVGNRGGSFELTRYMRREADDCNCYDQAAAIQTLSAALGIALGWRYLSPFGYIKTTQLVGVGWCNNPFFGSDASQKVVAVDSPERSAFGNHAFIADAAELTLDGCAGPHVGEETAFQYLSASIDDTPALYRGRFRPGRVHDIVPTAGVRRVS